MRKLLLASTALFAFASPASAVEVITLTQLGQGLDTIAQSGQNPAIIAGTTAQNPGDFGYNSFAAKGGSGQSYDMYSSNTTQALADGQIGEGYLGSFLQTFALLNFLQTGGSFGIAIDVNTAGGGPGGNLETLNTFQVLNLTTGMLIAELDVNQQGVLGNIGDPLHNGNGKADYLLTGFNLFQNILDGNIALTDRLSFHANWSNGSDGFEQFYLVPIPAVQAVPELSTWAMFIIGFAGIGGLAMHKRRNASLTA